MVSSAGLQMVLKRHDALGADSAAAWLRGGSSRRGARAAMKRRVRAVQQRGGARGRGACAGALHAAGRARRMEKRANSEPAPREFEAAQSAGLASLK